MFRISKAVSIGGFDHVKSLTIGGGSPIVAQTMWKDRLSLSELDGEEGAITLSKIKRLEKLGCKLLRFGVPDIPAAEALGQLSSMTSMPLVADIHFDYKIALRCLDFPVAKIRINPGNIGSAEKQKAVIEKAGKKNIPIRIGVNAGSLPVDLRKGFQDYSEALVKAAERELAIFDKYGFTNVLVSMKASRIADNIKANRLLAERTDVPLHIGVTEAGPLIAGVVRNSAAILDLLREGIGDTIRVSLTDSMENELIAAREILLAASELMGKESSRNEISGGVKIISCPRCGRYGFDTNAFLERWLEKLYGLDSRISVAIMGCAVNGPGEAKDADLGITGAGNKVLVFSRGKVIKTIEAEEADEVFEEELKKTVKE